MSNQAAIVQTEQRIAEVSALQQTIAEVQNELHVFREELRKEIAALRQPEAAVAAPVAAEAPPARPRPTPAAPEPSAPPAARPGKPPASKPLPRLPIDDEIDEMAAEDNGDLAAENGPPEKDEVSVGGRPVSVKIANGLADSEPQSGWVIDRPSGGLRILVDEPMQAGTVVSLRPAKDHPQNQWVNVSIKTCRPERNSYVINVQFTERPPWAVMNLLNGM